MAEFIRTEKKVVNVGEPLIFENNTDSDFSVSAAIVFRKSGLYDVSIVGGRTVISKVAERKTGKWSEKEVLHKSEAETVIEEWQSCKCSVCGRYDTRPYLYYFDEPHFCSWCGADMRGEQK